MKNTAALPINRSRHQRLMLWAGLWCAWAAAFLSGTLGRFRVRALDAALDKAVARMAHVVACLLLTQAALTLPRRKRRAGARLYDRRRLRRPNNLLRAMIGAAIRRLLRAPTPEQRIALLANVLRNPAPVIAQLAKRLARGFTQLETQPSPLGTAGLQARLFTAFAVAPTQPCFADSS